MFAEERKKFPESDVRASSVESQMPKKGADHDSTTIRISWKHSFRLPSRTMSLPPACVVGKPVLMSITIRKTATLQIGMNIEAQSRFQLNRGLDHSEVNFRD